MLKCKVDTDKICRQWGSYFRPIPEVQQAFLSRSVNDEALCAVLWEYKDCGKKGYDLTERFFDLVRSTFPNPHISGPERAGQDNLLVLGIGQGREVGIFAPKLVAGREHDQQPGLQGVGHGRQYH